jgi:adenylate cyclase
MKPDRTGAVARKIIAGISLGLVAAGLILLLGEFGWLDVLEMKTYDWRVRQSVASPPRVNPDIVLVEINETSLRDLQPFLGRWPWPRVAMAKLVDYFNRGPAKVIAIDVGLYEAQRNVTFRIGDDGPNMKGEESDAALAKAIGARPNVVLLADAVYAGKVGSTDSPDAPPWKSAPYRLSQEIEERPITPPFSALTDGASGLGHNFLPVDPDGPVRRMPPFVRNGDRYLPAFGIAAAILAEGIAPDEVVQEGRSIRIRDRRIPLVPVAVRDAQDPRRVHDQQTMLIDYRAPALVNGESPFTSYEVRHLLFSEIAIEEGQTPDPSSGFVDPQAFKDKIVFIGLTASGLLDAFQTPFGSQGTMPGIQLHASMADSILSNHFVTPTSDRSHVLLTIGAAILVGLMSALLPFGFAAAGAVAAAAGWSWWSLSMFKGGLWVAMAQPLLAMGLALFAGTAYRYFVEDAEKRKVSRLFGRYVSRDVYDQLLANPASAELGGARRDMTVLFSDIRGFTSVTEKGDPEALVGQLNEYFTQMVEIVFRHHGTVDKFVGDMVMALFGAPLDDVDHAENAARAAVDMVRELGALNERWAADGRPALDIGIGINSGDMIAGNIGSSAIMSYTVIGDNVNLGSRLESLNKDYRTRIIVSDATRARLTGDYKIRPLGDVIVKGKTRPVSIFEIVVPSPIPSVPEEVKL